LGGKGWGFGGGQMGGRVWKGGWGVGAGMDSEERERAPIPRSGPISTPQENVLLRLWKTVQVGVGAESMLVWERGD
jgi:hypothetical protein